MRADQKSLISDDGVGLSAVHIADALGANVVAVDVEQSKLDAASDLGADETLDASGAENVGSEVQALAGGGANVAVDALGIAETCRNALDSLGTHGQHLQIGLTTSDEGGQVPLPTDAMVMQEIDFLGSFGMPPNRTTRSSAWSSTARSTPARSSRRRCRWTRFPSGSPR